MLDESARPHNVRETQNFDYFKYDYNKFMTQKNQFYHGDNIRTLLEDVGRAEVEKGNNSLPRNKSKSPVPVTSEQSCSGPKILEVVSLGNIEKSSGNQPKLKKDSK